MLSDHSQIAGTYSRRQSRVIDTGIEVGEMTNVSIDV